MRSIRTRLSARRFSSASSSAAAIRAVRAWRSLADEEAAATESSHSRALRFLPAAAAASAASKQQVGGVGDHFQRGLVGVRHRRVTRIPIGDFARLPQPLLGHIEGGGGQTVGDHRRAGFDLGEPPQPAEDRFGVFVVENHQHPPERGEAVLRILFQSPPEQGVGGIDPAGAEREEPRGIEGARIVGRGHEQGSEPHVGLPEPPFDDQFPGGEQAVLLGGREAGARIRGPACHIVPPVERNDRDDRKCPRRRASRGAPEGGQQRRQRRARCGRDGVGPFRPHLPESIPEFPGETGRKSRVAAPRCDRPALEARGQSRAAVDRR